MSDREALHAYIDRLTDDEAQSLWQRIQCEELHPRPPLTAEEKELVDRALASAERGETVPHEEVMRRFRMSG